MKVTRRLVLIVLVVAVAGPVGATSWPTHRGNSSRTGATDQELTLLLRLQWSRQETHPPAPSFKKTHIKQGFIPAITHDYANQVIAADGMAFFGSSSEDCVRALDVADGKLLWTFYCDAAVRLAPTYADGKVLFGSDGGHVYCVDAKTGKEIWRYTPVKAQRWALNNGRLMSHWPIRTGVAVEDGVAYFAAGFLPPHGIYVCALDVEKGTVVWQRRLDVNAASALQGHIMIGGDVLYFPTGRTSPVEINKRDGSFVVKMPFDYRRSGGGVGVTALGGDVVAYGPTSRGVLNIRARLDDAPRKYPLKAQGGPRGRVTSLFAQGIATDEGAVYLLRTYRAPPGSRNERNFKNCVQALDRGAFLKALHTATGQEAPRFPHFGGKWFVWQEDRRIIDKLPDITIWKQDASDQSLTMIVAGKSLIIGGRDFLEARDPETGQIAWTSEVQGDVWSLAVSDESLLAATDRGMLYCFGPGEPEAPVEHKPVVSVPYKDAPDYARATELALASTGRKAGFCVVLDASEGQLAWEIARRSDFYVIGLETDPDKVAVARSKLSRAGLYGQRVVVHHCPTDRAGAYGRYFANLIVADACIKGGLDAKLSYVPEDVFRMLRPYGGVCLIGRAQDDEHWTYYMENTWPQGGVPGWHPLKDAPGYCMVERGPLPGAGNWSHMYANPANTANSNDALVTGVEFDLQWMGPPGTERIINRHMTPMGPLYMDGRLYVFGYDYVTVVDAYNGTFLWEKEIPNSSRILMALNAAPICVDERYFYSISANECWVMDVRTGETVRRVKGPREEDDWGFIASTGTYIIGTNQNPKARMRRGGRGWNWKILHGDASGKPNPSKSVVSDVLFVMDAETHERMWTREEGIILNSSITVAGGVIYFAEHRNEALRANGVGYVSLDEFAAKDGWFVAVDLKTGKELWERPIDMRVMNVLYLVKAKKDTLLALSAFATVEKGGQDKPIVRTNYQFRAMDSSNGAARWTTLYQADAKGILTNETNHNQFLMHPNIIDNKIMMNFYPGPMGVFDLATGKEESFKLRTRRCTPMAASATNGFYRAGYCSTYDFHTGKEAPVTRITRPSCWISMLPGGGLMMMPEYGSTSCNCGYPIQTSVVMVPRSSPGAADQGAGKEGTTQ